MCARPLEHHLVTSNVDGVGEGGGKAIGTLNEGRWVKQRRGAAEQCSMGWRNVSQAV